MVGGAASRGCGAYKSRPQPWIGGQLRTILLVLLVPSALPDRLTPAGLLDSTAPGHQVDTRAGVQLQVYV